MARVALWITAGLASSALCGASGGAWAQAQPGRLIEHPEWVEAGDPGKLGDLFPAKAIAAGLATGRVVLDCVADASGRMGGCQVLSEDPAGMDFGPAALKLAATMAIAPKDQDGQAVTGAHVRFAVRINKPDPAEAQAARRSKPIENPIWRRTPNNAEQADAVPTAAAYRGLNGRVDVRCRVQADGHLGDCRILLETPPGFGVAEGALKLVSKYEIAPMDRDGLPTVGREVPLTLELLPRDSGPGGAVAIRPVWASAPTRQDVEAARGAAPSADLPDRMVFQCRLGPMGELVNCRPVGPGDPRAVMAAAAPLLAKFRLSFEASPTVKDPTNRKWTFRPDRAQPVIQWRAIPSADDAIANPMWVKGPSAAEMGAAFPSRAAALGLTNGQVGLACTADTSGRLTGCQVLAEAPAGQGFGGAALTLVKDMALNPWTDDGRPAEGRRVSFTMVIDQPAAKH
jgi:outer membrane biosynthesis protein TonB